jgi:hypothetical protein
MASLLRQAGIRSELYLGSGTFRPQMNTPIAAVAPASSSRADTS